MTMTFKDTNTPYIYIEKVRPIQADYVSCQEHDPFTLEHLESTLEARLTDFGTWGSLEKWIEAECDEPCRLRFIILYSVIALIRIHKNLGQFSGKQACLFGVADLLNQLKKALKDWERFFGPLSNETSPIVPDFINEVL